MNVPDIAELMIREYAGATNKYGKFNSPHEGYAIILEELDELKDEVFKKERSADVMMKEAIQIGAMAMRFVYDICIEKD